MWIGVATQVTIPAISAESVSKRSVQAAWKPPAWIQSETGTASVGEPLARPCARAARAQTEARIIKPMLTSCAARSPMTRPNRPAMIAPNSGAKTATANREEAVLISALHHRHVLDLDRAAITEIHGHD